MSAATIARSELQSSSGLFGELRIHFDPEEQAALPNGNAQKATLGDDNWNT